MTNKNTPIRSRQALNLHAACVAALADLGPELSIELIGDECRFGVSQIRVVIAHTSGARVACSVQAHRGHCGIVDARGKIPAPVRKAIEAAGIAATV